MKKHESKGSDNNKLEDIRSNFSEVEQYKHEQNPVAKAQKQAASQETTGLLEQEQD